MNRYDAKGNVLRISLLRSPTSPDPEADQGKHQFSYWLYPHAGYWKQALTVRRGDVIFAIWAALCELLRNIRR